jgi:hypothetical protein
MSLLDNKKNTLSIGDVSYQRSLFPVEAVVVNKSSQNSADLKLIVTASNNKDYATKTVADGNGYVPASELFCYELAAILEVPTPEYSIIVMPDKSLAFGSVWEGGVHHIKSVNQISDILQGKVKVRELKRFFSQVYGLDLFINNIDRHFGNYLFRQSYQVLIGLAFDYSRAWYEVDAYKYSSLNDLKCNTQICHNVIKNNKLYDKRYVEEIFDRLLSVSSEQIVCILKIIPDEWLDKVKKADVASWWDSDDMKDRIRKLKIGS